MPTYEVNAPDGKKYRVNAPDGASQDDAIKYVQDNFYQSEAPKVDPPAFSNGPLKIGKEAMPDTLRGVLNDTDWLTRNIAGAGTAVTNAWEGLKQFVGKGDQAAIENNKIIEESAPVGSIAGNVALTALPFGVAGAGVKAAVGVGAGMGALQPVEGDQSLDNIVKGKAINTAVGGALGGTGQAIANKAGAFIGNKMQALAESKAKNALIDQTLQDSRQAGYVVPPSMMPDSGVLSRVLEGISGKYKTNQLAGIKNQQITNSLVRSDLGIPDNVPLSQEAIKAVRAANYKPYEEIANLPKLGDTPAVQENTLLGVHGKPGSKGFDPSKTLEELKVARADSTAYFNAYNRSAHPEDLAKARSFQGKADKLESSLEDYASSVGRSDLVDQLRDARKMIAKTYTAERALDKGTGNIDARVLGRLFDKNKPLSDGMESAGKFASSFGEVAKVPASGHANPFTIIDAGYSLGGGALNPLAYALPLARVGARYGLLSDVAQNAISAPVYAVSPAVRMTGGLLKHSPVGLTALGLKALN